MTKFTEEQWDALLEMMQAFARAAAWAATDNDREYEERTRADAIASDYKALFVEEPDPAPVEETPAHVGKWVAKPHTGCGAAVDYGVYNPVLGKWYENADEKPYRWMEHRAAVQEAKRLNAVEL